MVKVLAVFFAALAFTSACEMEARPRYTAEVTGTGMADIIVTANGEEVFNGQKELPFSYPLRMNTFDIKLSAISVDPKRRIACLIISDRTSDDMKIEAQQVGTEVNCEINR